MVIGAKAVAEEGEAAAVASVIAIVEIVKGAVIRREAGQGVVAQGEVSRTVEVFVKEEEGDVLEMMTGAHLAGEVLGMMNEARLGQGPMTGRGLEEEETTTLIVPRPVVARVWVVEGGKEGKVGRTTTRRRIGGDREEEREGGRT